MDFNENKLINQTYENDWLIEETYRQSDFHQCHFNNITTQDIVFEGIVIFIRQCLINVIYRISNLIIVCLDRCSLIIASY